MLASNHQYIGEGIPHTPTASVLPIAMTSPGSTSGMFSITMLMSAIWGPVRRPVHW